MVESSTLSATPGAPPMVVGQDCTGTTVTLVSDDPVLAHRLRQALAPELNRRRGADFWRQAVCRSIEVTSQGVAAC